MTKYCSFLWYVSSLISSERKLYCKASLIYKYWFDIGTELWDTFNSHWVRFHCGTVQKHGGGKDGVRICSLQGHGHRTTLRGASHGPVRQDSLLLHVLRRFGDTWWLGWLGEHQCPHPQQEQVRPHITIIIFSRCPYSGSSVFGRNLGTHTCLYAFWQIHQQGSICFSGLGPVHSV